MSEARRLETSTTKTDVTTDHKAFVTLRFAGDDLDPDAISAVLGIAPARAHRKGEEFVAGPRAGKLRGRTGLWFLATDKLVPSDELQDHLAFVERLLYPERGDQRRIGDLRNLLERMHFRAHITCFWRGEPGEPQPQIPDHFRSAVKPLAADIETDFATASEARTDEPCLESNPSPMSNSLILQIQESALDSGSSITNALRRAKLACAKLQLLEFGTWIDLELEGYMNKSAEDLPEYRKLRGIPKAFNPYQGWQVIIFRSNRQLENLSLAPIGMSISAIETSLRGSTLEGEFHFPYPPEVQHKLMKSLNWGPSDIQIALSVPQVAQIIDSVRNILLEWTINMEKQGVLGRDLSFSQEDRAKSARATAQSVSNIYNIGQIATFVQNAESSVAQGELASAAHLVSGTHDLIEQIEQLLTPSDLPADMKDQARAALSELREAVNAPEPNSSRLRRGLDALKRVFAPAGEHLLKIAVDAVVTRLTSAS
jgi:hypothetical protein